MAARTAIVFGVTGIVGRGVADHLRAEGGWNVIGVSRNRPDDLPGIEHVACDLLDAAATRQALAGRAATQCSTAPGCGSRTRRRIAGSMAR